MAKLLETVVKFLRFTKATFGFESNRSRFFETSEQTWRNSLTDSKQLKHYMDIRTIFEVRTFWGNGTQEAKSAQLVRETNRHSGIDKLLLYWRCAISSSSCFVLSHWDGILQPFPKFNLTNALRNCNVCRIFFSSQWAWSAFGDTDRILVGSGVKKHVINYGTRLGQPVTMLTFVLVGID